MHPFLDNLRHVDLRFDCLLLMFFKEIMKIVAAVSQLEKHFKLLDSEEVIMFEYWRHVPCKTLLSSLEYSCQFRNGHWLKFPLLYLLTLFHLFNDTMMRLKSCPFPLVASVSWMQISESNLKRYFIYLNLLRLLLLII